MDTQPRKGLPPKISGLLTTLSNIHHWDPITFSEEKKGNDINRGVKSHLEENFLWGRATGIQPVCGNKAFVVVVVIKGVIQSLAQYCISLPCSPWHCFWILQSKRKGHVRAKGCYDKRQTFILLSSIWNPYDHNTTWQQFHVKCCSPGKSCQRVLAEWGKCHIETQRTKYVGSMEQPLWALRNNWERENFKNNNRSTARAIKVRRKWEQ